MTRILVVDDDKDIRHAIAGVLEDEGYLVIEAGNGLEALDYLRAHELPKLIILDLMMPVMNGWEFRAEQQADPILAGVPVVVFSASYHSGMPIPADHFLTKPVDLETLFSMVERFCS